MPRSTRRDGQWKRMGGLVPRGGEAKSREQVANAKALEAARLGKKYFRVYGELYVLSGGEFMEWGVAPAAKIGRDA